MAKPQDGSQIYPEIYPGAHTHPDAPAVKRPRKRPASYLGVTCEGSKAGYRLRWVAPATGKRRSERLPDGLSAKQRDARRKAKAADVAAERDELAQRADRQVRGALTVAEAIEQYFGVVKLAPRSVTVYRPVAESFLAWCAANDIGMAWDLRKAHLRLWRAERINAPKRIAKPGGKRGERQDAGTRSKASANRELRALSAILNHLREDDLLRLSSDDICTGLKREDHKLHRRDFLQAQAVRELLAVAAQHDAVTYALTRDGSRATPRHKPVAPILRCAVLTGMRQDELLGLCWEHVQGDRIHIPDDVAKNDLGRIVDLTVSPSALPERPADASGSVFGLTLGEVVAARKRLLRMGAPAFTFHGLRRTCGTFLTCAPSIYGGASAYMSARRLGHSVTIAEKHYTGIVTVDPEARTLEQALGLSGRMEAAQRQMTAATDALVDATAEEIEASLGVLAALADFRVLPPRSEPD